MKQKISKLCDLIDNELNNITELIAFKIGKTSDLENRESKYFFDGFTDFNEIAKGTAETINYVERELIKHFKEVSIHRDKCENEIVGGGPSDKANLLYIAVKCNVNSIDELYDDIFISNELPIELD